MALPHTLLSLTAVSYIVGWMKGWRIALPYILSVAGTICSCACMCVVLPDCLDSGGTNLCGELE